MGTRFKPELVNLMDERDHVMILLNLMENADAADCAELDALRRKLKDLELRIEAGQRRWLT